MPKLPVAKPKELLKALLKEGFVVKRKSGSHLHLAHHDGRSTSIAMHSKPIPPGTLHAILKQTRLTVEKLKKLI
ncbi:hypothetical protein A2Z23_03410 [Candidatus Curtissbacteria bacterium RBG_16_39_7]|uniref:Addiction module toxin, HicA family n=1 Tax=Candidatus Curtissbacteria bacterium RBG_16_39_7 TaxID=1797707 RepID=A0A1F5G2P4_9BACT|nr:MAG: hypothetical protein A2Z23_03410 [Candidatus Curtissbacteria bacterium RBG_16_39_7]